MVVGSACTISNGMDQEESQKLITNLNNELKEIDEELSRVASENPAVRGDYYAKVEDLGSSPDDTAEEASELDRNQALVASLEERRREIVRVLSEVKAGTYGK
ncbi:MAG: hypothetical protein HYT62_02275 [Candidatus Yanofskybacteria bacterium]|nr:hypothetical protein [Candidatus Yanofskybacteria bacterium]